MNDAIAERIAAALERQVQQFDESYARRVAIEDAHVARVEKNRADDLARIAQEDSSAIAATRELMDEIVRLRTLVETRVLPLADAAVAKAHDVRGASDSSSPLG